MQFTDWYKLEEWLRTEIPGYESENKTHSAFHRFLSKIVFWYDYIKVWTTVYPKVLLPDLPLDAKLNPRVLEHEAVHLLDAKTFFGLLPWMPIFINVTMYYILFATPQIFALLSLFAIFNLWWLLALLFVLPIPSPIRMISEVRAYRRSIELGANKESVLISLMGWTYYKMFPFKRTLAKMLDKPSPYKEMMDKILAE